MKNKWLAFIFFLLLIILFWSVGVTYFDVLSKGFWFQLTEDEAIFSEVIEVLKANWIHKEWNGEPFSPWITAGPAALLPPAIFSYIFNIPGSVSGRVFSFLFHLGSLYFLLKLILEVLDEKINHIQFQRDQKKDFTVFFTALLFALFYQSWRTLSESTYFIFGVFGESAAYFYLIVSFYFLNKSRFVWLGFFSLLAVLAKPYMLILPLSYIFSFILLIFVKKIKKQNLVWFFLGCFLPFVFYILWMMVVIGISETFHYWSLYPTRMRALTGGGRLSQLFTGDIQIHEQFIKTLSGYLKLVKIRGVLLHICGVLFIVYSLFRWKQMKHHIVLLLTGSVFLCAHGVWWFFLTDGNIARYLAPFMIIGWSGFLFLIGSFLIKKSHWFLCHRFYIFLIFIILGSVFSVRVYQNWNENLDNFENCGFCRQLYVQKKWSELSERKPLFTSSKGYSQERAYILSSYYEIRNLKLEDLITNMKQNEKIWFLIGDYPEVGTLKWIQEKQKNQECQSLIQVPGRYEGVWECFGG